MTYEKMTGALNLEELEIQAEEVKEASAGNYTILQCILMHEWCFSLGCF